MYREEAINAEDQEDDLTVVDPIVVGLTVVDLIVVDPIVVDLIKEAGTKVLQPIKEAIEFRSSEEMVTSQVVDSIPMHKEKLFHLSN